MDDVISNYRKLTDLGSCYPLNITLDSLKFYEQLDELNPEWPLYNKSKPSFQRYGLSLFSLDGSSSGEIDLNSVREYNLKNGTLYDEMSFRTPTQNWHRLPAISEPLKAFEPFLGRSHIIKMQEGGIFPPHRDLGKSFRLLAFINCLPSHFRFIYDGQFFHYMTNVVYFVDTMKEHSVVSFQRDAKMLVLNVEVSDAAVDLVRKNLGNV